MEENKQTPKDNSIEKVCEQVDKKIGEIAKAGVQQTNIDYLGKLIDIKKDIKNMDHMKKEDETMMYRGYDNYGTYDNYGNYGGGRRRDSQGRYMDGMNAGKYGRRYRGDDMIDDMSMNYGRYMENRENGRYGSPETDKAFDYMVQSAIGFIDHIFEEIDSPEQAEKFKRELKRTFEKRM